MAKIIGLHSKAGGGKDTIANHLKTYFPRDFRSLAFADAIREMLKAGFQLTDAHFERPLKNEPLEIFGGKSPRDLMKPLGTEWGREMIWDKLWITRIANQVGDYLGAGFNVIITDVRFDNEAEWIRSNGGVIWHIDRKEGVEVHSHKSEAGVKFVKGVDVRINNNETLGYLFDTVEGLAKQLLAEADLQHAVEDEQASEPEEVVKELPVTEVVDEQPATVA